MRVIHRILPAPSTVISKGPVSHACWQKGARAQGIYDRLLKRLAKLSLVIIDDFGLASLSELEKQDLLEAIEERYGSGATIVTSQLPIGDWHAYLGDGRLADAILDRLVHNAHRIELSSKESMRKERPALNHGGHSAK
jgi:DNA replication protein DnaC